MTALEFSTAAKIICAPGSVDRLGELAAERSVRRVLFVCDDGLLTLGLVDKAVASLEHAGLSVEVFSDVEADPSARTVESAAHVARSARIDAVVGFGGGSPMDVATAVSLLAGSRQTLSEIYGVDKATGPRLPLILVPTTAGTGSEVTPISILTIGQDTKMGVVSGHLLPDVALLDADLTLGLAPHITAATGIDAMVHAIEAYTSAIKKNPVSDALAKEALSLLGRGVPSAYSDGGDIKARADALLGASLAGMAFANAPVAAVHALAYPIGARYHVPHGVSNALVLPHVLRFNFDAAQHLYGELAPLICNETELAQAPSPAAALLEKLESLCNEMNLPRRLGDVGIAHEELDGLAGDAMKQTRLLVNNPRPISRAEALAIYQAAF